MRQQEEGGRAGRACGVFLLELGEVLRLVHLPQLRCKFKTTEVEGGEECLESTPL